MSIIIIIIIIIIITIIIIIIIIIVNNSIFQTFSSCFKTKLQASAYIYKYIIITHYKKTDTLQLQNWQTYPSAQTWGGLFSLVAVHTVRWT